MEPAELAAVAFGVLYILLAIREHRACWIAGGISTAIYAVVFLDAGLPLQAALQVVYVAMSVYGWLAWNQTPPRRRRAAGRSRAISRRLRVSASRQPRRAPLAAHFALAAAPVADSLGTWASLVATWLLARRIAETGSGGS